MSKTFFSDRIIARIGRPTQKLLEAVVREQKKSNRKITLSDVVRVAIIRDARRILGKRADDILIRGIEIGGRR